MPTSLRTEFDLGLQTEETEESPGRLLGVQAVEERTGEGRRPQTNTRAAAVALTEFCAIGEAMDDDDKKLNAWFRVGFASAAGVFMTFGAVIAMTPADRQDGRMMMLIGAVFWVAWATLRGK
jgi:hypothetical protein